MITGGFCQLYPVPATPLFSTKSKGHNSAHILTEQLYRLFDKTTTPNKATRQSDCDAEVESFRWAPAKQAEGKKKLIKLRR